MTAEGVLYVAVGEEYVAEARRSARSVRETNPEVAIGLIADEPTLESDAVPTELFDDLIVAEHAAGDLRDKAYNLHLSPYERTVYLDTDVLVTRDIADMFGILDEFDVAAAHAPLRKVLSIPDIPDTFPEFNGGVLCFRGTDAVEAFVERWQSIYRRQVQQGRPDCEIVLADCESFEDVPNGRKHDQPPLREALYQSDLRVATLPPEFNFRGSGYAQLPVTVLHSRHPRVGALAEALNRHEVPRVVANWRNRIYCSNGEKLSAQKPLYYRLGELSERTGTTDFLKRVGLYPLGKAVYDALAD
jgi:hypothetical protein